jgi:hypothetical protein
MRPPPPLALYCSAPRYRCPRHVADEGSTGLRRKETTARYRFPDREFDTASRTVRLDRGSARRQLMKGICKRRPSRDHGGYAAIERNVLTALAKRSPHALSNRKVCSDQSTVEINERYAEGVHTANLGKQPERATDGTPATTCEPCASFWHHCLSLRPPQRR